MKQTFYRITKGTKELCRDGKLRGSYIPKGQGLQFPTEAAAQAVCPAGMRVVAVTLHAA